MDKDFMQFKGFGNWYNELDTTYKAIFTDDLDSWFSSWLIQQKFGCKLDIFNDFRAMYLKEGVEIDTLKNDKMFGVDLDLSRHKCFSNHVTYIQNEDCISLNRGIGRKSYCKKFAGSTFLTVLSLYDFNLSDFTPEQLEILICIDSAYLQYDFDKELFKHYYSDILGYPNFVDLVANHDKQYFQAVAKKYNLKGKIKVNDKGYLETTIKLDELSQVFGIDLSLPTEKFILFFPLDIVAKNGYRFNEEFKDNKDMIFSSAVTQQDFIVASILQ